MIEPYYSDEMVTIYHGQCQHVMPNIRHFDLMLTDPPYGIGEGASRSESRPDGAPVGPRNPRGTIVRQRRYDRTAYDDHETAEAALSIAMDRCALSVVWGGNYYRLPPSPSWIVWDKKNGGNDFSDVELAWANTGGGARIFRWLSNGMLKEVRGAHEEARVHPNQKPVALMSFCLQYAKAEPTWRVLDPFMGSGTTLVACRKAGIRSVGIDAEEKYCEIAAKRVSQRSLFEQAQ